MRRTTITLSSEADAALQNLMRERAISFKEAVNTAILEGAPAPPQNTPFRTKTYNLGARIPLDHATTLVGELDDIEFMRKRDMGK
ncbi:MAG: antitoxin [Solirubrobacterales bacterium]|nr:antitoxin [Solirubrobacterales bacterium]